MGDIVRRGSGWYVRYKDADGVRRQRASHQPTKELARRYLVEVEARIARGLVGVPEAMSAGPTVAELVDRFMVEYSRSKIKDLATYRRHARAALRRALPLLGAVPADRLQTEQVADLRDQLGRDFAPASVRVTLAFMKVAFSWAMRVKLVSANPVRGVELPIPEAAVEYLSKAEAADLLGLARARAPQGVDESRLATAVELALRTGLRRGELLGLRWQDLDLDTRRLTVARSFTTTPKSGKARHLRLPVACVEPLREWRRVGPCSALVFPGPSGGCYSKHAMLGLAALMRAAGIRPPAHPWHALRHTFASHYIMSGGNILALQRILGHSDVKQTAVYAHLAHDFLGDEMDRIKF